MEEHETIVCEILVSTDGTVTYNHITAAVT